MYKSCKTFLVLALLCALPSVAADAERHILTMLPMEDGTKLATEVWMPEKGEGPWPVVLCRSTYSRPAGFVKDFVKRGYVGVIQDIRGMHDSEGKPRVFYSEGWREGFQDGPATVDWILAQPWCDGKVATFGGSALGITQILLAPATQNLTAQVITVAPDRLYGYVSYQGGVLRKSMVEGWMTAIQQPHMIPEYKTHTLDDDYWSYYNSSARARDITAPTVFVGGWYDIFQQGTLDAFRAWEEDGGESAKGQNYLIMNWAAHGPDKSPDYAFPENRHDFRISEVYKKFYQYHLDGQRKALDDVAKVNYYVMGADTPGAPGNEWRTADAWPPYETEATTFYLHPAGALSGEKPEADDSARTYTYDPEVPVKTHGGANLLMAMGPYDQREVSTRDDVLKFESTELDAPMEITGRVTVQLQISTDAPDTDFTAKLVDIHPEGDGRELLLLDGIRRVKTRNGYDKNAPLLDNAEEVVTVEIDLWSTAWIFDKGHKIGLHISSSNYPRFEKNPNTGADFPVEGEPMRKARNTIHTSSAHPSVLILPVRPAQ